MTVELRVNVWLRPGSWIATDADSRPLTEHSVPALDLRIVYCAPDVLIRLARQLRPAGGLLPGETCIETTAEEILPLLTAGAA